MLFTEAIAQVRGAAHVEAKKKAKEPDVVYAVTVDTFEPGRLMPL